MAVQDLSETEIFELGANEPDALRATLLLPVERYKRKIAQNPDTEKFLSNQLVKVTLGDDHDTYQTLRTQSSALQEFGSDLVSTVASLNAQVADINSGKAVEPDISTEGE